MKRDRFPRILWQLLRELFAAFATIFLLSNCVFFAMRLLPGDPTTLILGEDASALARSELRHRLGLDLPLGRQWIDFVWGWLRFDFGESLVRPGMPVAGAIGRALLPTAWLAGLAVLLGSTFGILAAVGSVGLAQARRRALVHWGILLAASVPLLSFGPVLTWIFAVRFPIVPLPGDPESGIRGLLFASTLLSIPLGAQVARVARASLLDQSRARYLDVARAKGASLLRVWLLHALPVAAPPIVVVVAMQLGGLLGGAVVLERLFERPGLGTLMLEAYRTRDLPLLEASVVAAGFLFVLAQTAAQIVNAALDPRRGEVLESA